MVVGAGPTGLTAATLLARQGVRCVVVERHTDPYPLPRAVHLDDEVLRIAQAAGVADAVAAVCEPALGLRLVDGHLRTLLELRRDKAVGAHGWPETNMFDQPDLERVLRTGLIRHPEVTLLPGHEVTDLSVRRDGRADVAVRPTKGVESHTVTAGFVLACDGAGSGLRDRIGSRMRNLGFDQHWLVVDLRCERDLDLWAGVHQICAGTDSGTFMRIGEHRYRWEFRIPAPGSVTDAEVAARLQPWFPDGAATVLRHTVHSHRAAVADTWRRGPVFLLGDAAHLTPPFIGQGMGAGQRDAMNLAWKIAAVLAGRADDSLLDTYQPERRAHVVTAVLGAVLVGRAMAAPTALHPVLRCVARLPNPDPIARRVLAPRLRGGVLAGRRSRSPIGATLPQWFRADGSRTDDVLGPGFAVLGTWDDDETFGALADDVGARRISVADLPESATWLARHRLRAAVIRPDRVVLAVVDDRGRVHGARAFRGGQGRRVKFRWVTPPGDATVSMS
ncbi:bifunctional 3-(3-hydroxy-phenyl)propionate/3-hydroxycinnamic acid hydroxylase [Rhodococcus triatomae]|nr:3-(3-hydroxyphenyl)propionate hydroxylase [Rhodococcus triatomae BKS 15-14]